MPNVHEIQISRCVSNFLDTHLRDWTGNEYCGAAPLTSPAQEFTVSDVIASANGCAGGGGPLDAAMTGFGRVMNGQHAQV
jgi:hypothetical protein